MNEVKVGLDILGLLLAMIGDSDWETESARKQFGDEILEKTASKLEEIEKIRMKKR